MHILEHLFPLHTHLLSPGGRVVLVISLFSRQSTKSWSNRCFVNTPYVDSSSWSLASWESVQAVTGRTPEDGLGAVARVETEWGHRCHLETCTECPPSTAPCTSSQAGFIPGFLPILGLLSGQQVGLQNCPYWSIYSHKGSKRWKRGVILSLPFS